MEAGESCPGPLPAAAFTRHGDKGGLGWDGVHGMGMFCSQ